MSEVYFRVEIRKISGGRYGLHLGMQEVTSILLNDSTPPDYLWFEDSESTAVNITRMHLSDRFSLHIVNKYKTKESFLQSVHRSLL